ncbi:glycoside hydrolase family 2, partial [bacterium]|nr:glycoside hydrolase family 2 [bacterium]
MKTLSLYLILLFVSSFSGLAMASFQRNILLDSEWTFHRGGCVGAHDVMYNDSAWRKINLPHDYSIEDIEGKQSPFDENATAQQSSGFTVGGVGWYRKQLDIPQSYSGKRIILWFDGVYNNSEIYLNGESVAKQPYGYSAFEIDLTKKMKYNAKNLIAVKVQNEGENTRWYSGSGIYRHVWLDVVDTIRVARYGTFITTPTVTAKEASVHINTTLVHQGSYPADVKVITQIKNANGVLVGKSESIVRARPGDKAFLTDDIKLANPILWSLDNPALYTAYTEVYTQGVLTDCVKTRFGIRSISFDVINGFQLNGKNLKLKGGCVHHDNGPLGAKAFDRAEFRKVELHKASGYNAIRTS